VIRVEAVEDHALHEESRSAVQGHDSSVDGFRHVASVVAYLKGTQTGQPALGQLWDDLPNGAAQPWEQALPFLGMPTAVSRRSAH